MEYRIKDYTIKGQRILLPKQTSIEDLRLIFNETQKTLICSTATKDNVSLAQGEGGTLVEVPASVCVLNSTDLLTIKCDYGDSVDDIRGENKEATNSAILEELGNVKETFDSLGIPISAISGLALELEGGKKNIANALKARGVESSVNTDTLTNMAAKVYEVKNPVAFTVPAETSNELADDLFNTMMKSQGYDQIYESIYATYCGEGGSYVGCLMTDVFKGTSAAIQLLGADAYYIYEEDIFYKSGEGGKLVQILNGVESQLTTDKHVWSNLYTNSRIVFYLYKANSTANGVREKTLNSRIDYCRNSTIPTITYGNNGGTFMYFHVNNVESCVLSYNGSTGNTRTIFFWSNVEKCSSQIGLTGNEDYMMYFNMESLREATYGKVLLSSSIRNVEFPNLEKLSRTQLIWSKSVKKIVLPKLTTLETTQYGDYTPFVLYGEDIYIDISNVEDLNKGVAINAGNIPFVASVAGSVYFKLNNKVTMHGGLLSKGAKVVKIDCKEMYSYRNKINGAAEVYGENIYFLNLRACRLHMGGSSGWLTDTKYININGIGGCNDLIELYCMNNNSVTTDVEVNQGFRQQLTLTNYNALTVGSLVTHILEKLADNRFEDDGVTTAPAIKITIGAKNLAKLTDEQKAIATDKNYILA